MDYKSYAGQRGCTHIAYHFRPPFPVYDGFDTYNLADLSYDEKAAEIEKYHMYKLDLETGLYIENVSGGYTLVKEYFGAPWTVGHTSSGSISVKFWRTCIFVTVQRSRLRTVAIMILGK